MGPKLATAGRPRSSAGLPLLDATPAASSASTGTADLPKYKFVLPDITLGIPVAFEVVTWVTFTASTVSACCSCPPCGAVLSPRAEETEVAEASPPTSAGRITCVAMGAAVASIAICCAEENVTRPPLGEGCPGAHTAVASVSSLVSAYIGIADELLTKTTCRGAVVDAGRYRQLVDGKLLLVTSVASAAMVLDTIVVVDAVVASLMAGALTERTRAGVGARAPDTAIVLDEALLCLTGPDTTVVAAGL